MQPHLRKTATLLLAFVVGAGNFAGGASRVASAAEPIKVELLMDSDPAFVEPADVVTVSPKLPGLWLLALARDEKDLKLQAAQAFAKARDLGLQPTDEIVSALRRELVAEKQPPIVAQQMATALIALDARVAAQDLFAQSQARGFDMQRIVEPALARWDFAPIKPLWRERLASADTRRQELRLAIEGLAQVGDQTSATPLAKLALDTQRPSDVRLQAAQAASTLRPVGFEPDARRLLGGNPSAGMIDRLVAATLVRHDTSKAAQDLLLKLAADPEPAIAAMALSQLLSIDAALAAPLNEQLVAHRDTKIRLLAVALLDRQETPVATKLLGPLLDDIHPGVRVGAREALIRLASLPALNDVVRATAVEVLQGDKVRGLEQAAVTLGALDHETSAPRLVALLDHREPRVFITAAWALRKLAVPATAPQILQRLHDETEKSLVLQKQLDDLMKKQKPLPDISHMTPIYDQLAHLIEALGVIGYREALPEFERYFPKPPIVAITDPPPVATTRQYPLRAAMVCALGLMFQKDPPADVVTFLSGRLRDEDPLHAESTPVRANSAVALVRMGAKDQIPALEKFFKPERGYSTLTHACGWALERLAGRPPFVPTPRSGRDFGWFFDWFVD
jgi:HEAT repeat protein